MTPSQIIDTLTAAAESADALAAHREAWSATDEAFAILRRAFALLALERWEDASRTFAHFLGDRFTNEERVACFLRYAVENHRDVEELARRGLGFAPQFTDEASRRATRAVLAFTRHEEKGDVDRLVSPFDREVAP